MREDLNQEAFYAAWEKVLERHAVLRTGFSLMNNEMPLQFVHRNVNITMSLEDLSTLSWQERERYLEEYLESDRKTAFELNKAPLMRLKLFHIGTSNYKFIWTFHHVLLDGRSILIVLKEVYAIYESLCKGKYLQLPAPRPYREYIEWYQKQERAKHKKFWTQQLKGFCNVTQLVTGRTYCSTKYHEDVYKRQELHLNENLSSALSSFAKQNQITVNNLLQGAWAILLSRYTGEEDIVFGTTRACRYSTIEGAESMVGMFINTLPFRVKINPKKEALPWLKGLRIQHVALREHEHTSLSEIQKWSEIPGGTPLFESILVFENYSLNSFLKQQGGAWKNRDVYPVEQTNYPITVMSYLDRQILLRIMYEKKHFDDNTIARMLGHLETLLYGLVNDPTVYIAELPLLTKAERRQLLVEWNDTATAYPQDKCIHELFEEQVGRTPGATAVVFDDQQLSYRELNDRSNQLAQYLQGKGVGPDTIVGICMERSLEMLVGLLGILKAGGAYVPLDPVLPDGRIAFMIRDTQATIIITQASLADRRVTNGCRVISLDADWPDIARLSIKKPISSVRPDNLAYVCLLYTSPSPRD